MPPESLRDLLFPDRDAEFARVVAALSEPETGPAADNLMTNEDSTPRVAGQLAREVPRGGVYLGVGPDANFTYLAHTAPELAFVLDYRRRNALLHLVHKALFSLASDRVAYLERLTARTPDRDRLGPDPDASSLVAAFQGRPFERKRLDATIAEVAEFLRPLGVLRDGDDRALATIQAKLAGPGLNAQFLALPGYPSLAKLIATPDRDGRPAHVLAAEPLYRVVRDLQRADRVLPLVADFAGSTALPRLAAWLRRYGRAVACLYVSDVEFFLLRAGRFEAYVANLAALPWAPGARLVRTSTRPLRDHPERVAGDSSTTVVRPVEAFLEAARAGRIGTPDDLFR